MQGHISLRPVEASDLPVFFEQQLDPEATRLAAFPSREREAFFKHWTTRILVNPDNACCTILFDGQVTGYIGAWTDPETKERLIGYWFGRQFWGRGIATAAVIQFLQSELIRPLGAHVAKHNLGSIRVLEKAGFVRIGEDEYTPPGGAKFEEYVYRLGS
ncbi:MAG TPA: GNAT family N-acetyltransferase [Opitutaceae bacterium]|jgi:RimJ/RimL family protein N-acetyltransferase